MTGAELAEAWASKKHETAQATPRAEADGADRLCLTA
jgi:hypothetical protein